MHERNNVKSFQKFKDLVSALHVTNDLRERGIKILEDYKNILTENSEQGQMRVEKSRRDRPEFKKATLAGSFS